MNGIEFLLDTNIVIGLLKNKPEVNLILKNAEAEPWNCAVSQITRMELLSYPKLDLEEEKVIENYLLSSKVINLTNEVETNAIAFRRKHQTKLPDSIIAATAQVYNLKLLTLDKSLKKKL